MLAKALARSIDCSVRRVQFTPDLLPSDVTGVSVYSQERGDFEFKPGAIFANIVVGDEINRASPKTQAALLESMEERQVTMDGVTYQLGVPFMVIATQNPIEHEGTYPLPEAQRDRFMLELAIGYPTREAEVDILNSHGQNSRLADISPVADAPTVAKMIDNAKLVHVADSLKNYIVDLVRATREHADLALGASPRAALSMLRAARATAAAGGRDYIVPDDIKQLITPVLAHRLIPSPEAQMIGRTAADVLDDIVEFVPIPIRGRGQA
jgi:MoxR-like ATPase